VPARTAVEPPPPETAVIRGKLAVPALPERRVVRPRVEQRLADLIDRHRVVAVSATAGAGKSTAVAAALPLLGRGAAWLTVDWTDSAAGRLLTYLEASLAGVIPRVRGVATKALSAGIPHVETAGLLAEAIGDAQLIVVLDDLERIEEEGEAWDSIEAFLRYAPAGVHTVLISRRAMPDILSAFALEEGGFAVFGESDLAFTPSEAAGALELLGDTEVDPAAAVEATGGWVAGVLFEAWRASEHAAGTGGEADPLHGYLSAHILSQLDPADREFLVLTSLLDEVDAQRAEALGRSDAGQRLASLRRARLPVSWLAGGHAFRCHPRFREDLVARLERRPGDEVRELRRAYGRLLAREGYAEEATEMLLLAGAPQEAIVSAEQAIIPAIERLDFAIAERWLEAFADAGSGSAGLATAELMLAYAQEDFRRAARVADRLAAHGERDAVARSVPAAAVLMGFSYAHLGRVDDMHAVTEAAGSGPGAAILRYGAAGLETSPGPPRPEPTGTLLDGLVLSLDYVYGRLERLVGWHTSGWAEAVAEPWRLAALSVTGRTGEALELYDALRQRGLAGAWLRSYIGPQLLIDAGLRERAREEIREGLRAAIATGSVHLELSAGLMEAKLALRLDRDPAEARAVLDRLESKPYGRSFALMTEQTDMWYGFAHLLQDEVEPALERLRAAVASMTAGDRVLELPTAAVYLAEAEWRVGDEEAADRAADLALDAARRQGSNHVLLRALADFPAVVSRRIDAERLAGSPWHELGRALIAQGASLAATVPATVELREFGRCQILVNGKEERPRIAKAYELLAYLAIQPDGQASREELLDALFEGRSDDSARSYLRQAVRWLRHVLPEQDALLVEGGRVRLGEDVIVTSESTWFERRLADTAALQGGERLAATVEALAVFDAGEYLPAARSGWVDERRMRLADLANDARYEAAELAFAEGKLDDAGRLAAEVLEADRQREAAWRLAMQVAAALGDENGVLRAYKRCEQALAEIGTKPAPTTRQLLERLRR
jgi:DNA-binding SARP family transcriptional activator